MTDEISDRTMDPAEFKWQPVPVEPATIRAFTQEGEFVGVAVELTKETAIFVGMAAESGHPNPAGPGLAPWPRDKAIVCGQFVRMYKLFHGLLTEACKNRLEVASIFIGCPSITD